MSVLVMGSIVCMGPDGEEGIPYDDAVIHLEGDEDSEIEVHCPNALAMAERIVKAVNYHDALVKALEQVKALCDANASADVFTDLALKQAGYTASCTLDLVGKSVGQKS